MRFVDVVQSVASRYFDMQRTPEQRGEDVIRAALYGAGIRQIIVQARPCQKQRPRLAELEHGSSI